MDLGDIKHNLSEFFRGKETREGRKLVDRWYHYFDDISNKNTEDLSNKEKRELRKELLVNIQASAGIPKTNQRQRRCRFCLNKPVGRIMIAAAGFIIVLLASLSILYHQGVLTIERQSAESEEYRIAQNPPGQTSQITLPDGSTVWLSAGSMFRYPQSFGKDIREVELKGEAFFDVARNPEAPFIVNSGHLKTKVLGTSFNIRAFESEQDIQVTVASGRVSVRQKVALTDSLKESADQVAVLAPDQQLVFNKKARKGVTQAVKSTLYTSWKDGKLIFENHSFEEIAYRLAQWYGVQIQFVDAALKHERFKISFENNSLEHALQMLQIIKDFEFEIEDRQVWIKPSS